MSEVDTNPKPSTDNPGTVGNEAPAPAADDTSNDVTNEGKTDDVTAKGPEAVQEGGEQTTAIDPGSRRSPEGSNNGSKNGEVSTSDGAVPASGADGADVQGSAETETGKPDASEARQEGGADGEGQSVSETAGGGETDKTPSAEGEGVTDGTDVSARQVEGAETSAEGQKTGDGAERTADSDRAAADDPGQDGDGRNEGQQPPATPTFSDDAGEQDAKDSGAGDAQAQRQPAEGDVAITAADDVESAQSPPLTASAAAQLTKRLTNTPADGNLPKPQTAHLPAIARGQVRAQQMTSAITDAVKNEVLPPPRQPIRYRRPPKYVRLATVTVSPARTRPLPHGPSLYYEEPKRPRKVITWDEAINARPPLRIDMEGPTPCSYTPRVKPLNETNAPSYTFGSKCQPEKVGGSRTSWSKSWFQTPHIWHNKVDFTRDGQWPSPFHYPKQSSLGPRQRTMPEAPSYTFGHKSDYSIIKPGAPKEPSPNEYRRQTADKLILPRGPAFTHQLRREGTMLWGSNEHTPGPAAYSPSKPSRERPSFTIQGIRREKSHLLGPYSAL